MYNLALSYVQNKEDAEEITQDVFVSIHESMDKFEGKSTLSTWVYRITINKCLDFIKTKNRKKRFAHFTSLFTKNTENERKELVHFDHPGVELEHKEALEILFKCINELPENQKTVLILCKIESKSQQEVAEIMNTSIKAVESLLQRAKSNLIKTLPSNEGNK